AALLRRRDLEVVHLVALLAHRHEVLFARLEPPHWPLQLPCHVADQDRLAVEGSLDAEPAALVARSDDAHLLPGNLEDVGHGEAVDVRALRRDPPRHAVAVIPSRERAARLQRRDTATVDAVSLFDDDVRGLD